MFVSVASGIRTGRKARFFFRSEMLKHRTIILSGRDAGTQIRLSELSAMEADRHARRLLRQLDEDEDGGISALAFKFSKVIPAKLGADALLPFVEGAVIEKDRSHSLDVRRDIRDWRNVERLQNAALLLHVDFLIGRESLEIPVTFQAQNILAGSGTVRATFCSPQIASVLGDRMATYRELETVLSTEDVFNLCEILNVAAIRDWHAQQAHS